MLEYCALRSVSLEVLASYVKVVARTQGVRRRLCAQKINFLEMELESEFSVLEMESQAVVKRMLLKRLFKKMCGEKRREQGIFCGAVKELFYQNNTWFSLWCTYL